jgi:hypothetical protein
MRYAAYILILLAAACAAPPPPPAEPPPVRFEEPGPKPEPVVIPAAVIPEPEPPKPEPEPEPQPEPQPVTAAEPTEPEVPPEPAEQQEPHPPAEVAAATPPPEPEVPPCPVALLREAAEDDPAAARMLVAALIADGSPAALAEAEQRLPGVQAPPAWTAAMRAAIAGLAGEHAELAGAARAMHLEALRLLPLEVGTIHISDDLGGVSPRDSISFRPDEYVSLAFEARHFGVRECDDGRWDWQVQAAARLLDAEGRPVRPGGMQPVGASGRPLDVVCVSASGAAAA